jgi:hypothetical protein
MSLIVRATSSEVSCIIVSKVEARIKEYGRDSHLSRPWALGGLALNEG